MRHRNRKEIAGIGGAAIEVKATASFDRGEFEEAFMDALARIESSKHSPSPKEGDPS